MKKKDLILLFVFLALVSIGDGFFYNFQELWMASNNFSLKTISVIYSICSLITVSVIFLCSSLIKKEYLKKFVQILLIFKIICVLSLYLLYSSKFSFLIKLFIMFDFVLDVELITSMYPMISLIKMGNKEYACKEIVYSASYYFGVVLTIILLGKQIGFIHFSYNSYLFVALMFCVLAFILLWQINLDKYVDKKKVEEKTDKLIIEKLLNDIKKDKISKLFLASMVMNQFSFNSALGLEIILLTSGIGLAPKTASGLSMMLGITSVFVATFVLNKLTFKNNYINIMIKYGGRLLFYALAAISGSYAFIICAVCYARLSSLSYVHVVDAPYVNRISKDYQLAFCNLKEMLTYLGKSLGLLFCGILMNIDLRLNFLFASILIIAEIYLRMLSLKYRLKEEAK